MEFHQLYNNNRLTPNNTKYLNWNDYYHFLWPTLSQHFNSIISYLKIKFPAFEKLYKIKSPLILINIPTCLIPFSKSLYYSKDDIKEYPFTENDLNLHFCPSNILSFSSHNVAVSADVICMSDNSSGLPLICVDFGSMTSILVEMCSISLFIEYLIDLSIADYQFIWICHSQFDVICKRFHAIIERRNREQQLKETNIISDVLNNNNEKKMRFFGNVKLINGESNHQTLFRSCVAVIHHGGVGTCSTSILTGIPQLVIPIMYDQFYWASIMQSLQLCACVIDFKSIFPLFEYINQDLQFYSNNNQPFYSPNMNYDIIDSSEKLRQILSITSSPQQRLRCGCYGRKAREIDSNQLNSRDAFHFISSFIKYELDETQTDCLDEYQKVDNYDSRLYEFENGLKLFTHGNEAIEETEFIYNEIFNDNIYLRHGIIVNEGDVVIDVGM
eukprot:gene4432-6268_t